MTRDVCECAFPAGANVDWRREPKGLRKFPTHVTFRFRTYESIMQILQRTRDPFEN